MKRLVQLGLLAIAIWFSVLVFKYAAIELAVKIFITTVFTLAFLVVIIMIELVERMK